MTAPATDAKVKAKGSSLTMLIVEILAVTLIAGGIGAVSAVPRPTPEHEAVKTADAPAPSNVLDLPAIVTNVGVPSDVWIRLEASVVFDPKSGPYSETTAAQIAGDILAYLRTVTVAQLEGPVGLQNIRQDLNERAAIRSGGKVVELIIKTLVVQ